MSESTATFTLLIRHGRKTKEEEMQNWGVFLGDIQGVRYVQFIYGIPYFHFSDAEAMGKAQEMTGWEDGRDPALELQGEFDGEFLIVKPTPKNRQACTMYYSDWFLQPS